MLKKNLANTLEIYLESFCKTNPLSASNDLFPNNHSFEGIAVLISLFPYFKSCFNPA